jgi:transglutaminase-like putative cysteine protease
MKTDTALKPYSSLPEPFVLMAVVVWIDLLAVAWPYVTDAGFALRAGAYGLLLGCAAAHTWFFARRALWSNASHLVAITALWLVALAGAVTWLEWGSRVPVIGLLVFVQVAQCSFLFNHATLRIAHVVAFVVMLVASMRLPHVGGGAAWLAFALLSMFVLAYDRTAHKAGPTGYDNGESRRGAQRLAIVSTVALVASALFFVTPLLKLPEFSRPKLPVPEEGRPSPQRDQFRIGGTTTAPDPSSADLEVMHVATDPPVRGPLYLRGQSFDTFDGSEWSNSRQSGTAIPLRGTAWTQLPFPAPVVVPVRSDPLTQTVEMRVNLQEVLFTASRPQSVMFHDGSETKVLVGASGRSIRVGGVLRTGTRYSIYGQQEVFSDAALRNVGYATSRDYGAADRAVPDDVDARVLAIARDVTAGAATPYKKAVALERYLRRTYYYSLTHDVGGDEVVNDFMLRARRGHCALFASSMVVMARSVGLPARYVTGFLAQEQRGGNFTVRGSDGHAWVEVYIHGAGWIAFDPTGGRIHPSDAGTHNQTARGRNGRDVRVDENARRGGGLYGRDGSDFDEGGASNGNEIARADAPEEGPGGAPVPGGNDPNGDPSGDGGDGPTRPGDTGGDPSRAGAPDAPRDATAQGGTGPGGSQSGSGPQRGGTVLPPGGGTSLPPRGDGEAGRRGGRPAGGGRESARGATPSTVERAAEPSRSADLAPPDPAQTAADWRALVMGVALAGLLGLVLLFVWRMGVSRVAEKQQIRRALPLSIDEDPDPRRFVVKLYHAMVGGLGRVGFPRRESETPHEYAVAVGGRDGQLSEPVGELTELFHVARYGDREVTAADATTARQAWHRIVKSVKRVSSG